MRIHPQINRSTRLHALHDELARSEVLWSASGEVHACVCQPVNDVGEPCAGEPHARCARDMTSSSGVQVPCGG
jgi:hypothetical protein